MSYFLQGTDVTDHTSSHTAGQIQGCLSCHGTDVTDHTSTCHGTDMTDHTSTCHGTDVTDHTSTCHGTDMTDHTSTCHGTDVTDHTSTCHEPPPRECPQHSSVNMCWPSSFYRRTTALCCQVQFLQTLFAAPRGLTS